MKIELLPVGRWHELERAFKESRSDEQLPEPDQSIMIAASEGDQIVGCIGAQRVWCISPLWIQREHRGNGLAMNLVKHLAKHNLEGLREMCVTTNSHVERLIHSIGFIPVEGQLWRRDVK